MAVTRFKKGVCHFDVASRPFKCNFRLNNQKSSSLIICFSVNSWLECVRMCPKVSFEVVWGYKFSLAKVL